MKHIMVTVVAVMAATSAFRVMADCAGYTIDELAGATLVGNTVTASGGGDQWVEAHCLGGALWKVGSNNPNDKVDPPQQVGTWSALLSVVTYNYMGGDTFKWNLYKNGSNLCWEKIGSGSIDTVTGTYAPNGTNVCK